MVRSLEERDQICGILLDLEQTIMVRSGKCIRHIDLEICHKIQDNLTLTAQKDQTTQAFSVSPENHEIRLNNVAQECNVIQ